METSLHRQLKAIYAEGENAQEVAMDGYRIDAVAGDRLIEIQHSSLAAIRDKVCNLLDRGYEVLVVKPLAARRLLIKRDRKRGKVVSRRYSPLRDSFFSAFDDLVHFMGVFPSPRLRLELVLAEIEEHRLPPLKGRRNRKGYRVEDKCLARIVDRLTLETPGDLIDMLPAALPFRFSTEDLASHAEIPRWQAQKVAYCLRKASAAQQVAKSGNSLLYELSKDDLRSVDDRRAA